MPETDEAGAFVLAEQWHLAIRDLAVPCAEAPNGFERSALAFNESPTLNRGAPQDLARRYAALLKFMPQIRVVGGCCGTDHRHISTVVDHLSALT